MAADILVVDDEADIRDLVAGILSDEGYFVRTAASSEEALAAIKSRKPSLLVLDIWMQGGGMDGLELLDLVKTLDADLPVLIISGHGNIETAVSAIKRGAYDFLEKPFAEEALLSAVRRALETTVTTNDREDARGRFAGLSQREREVLTHLISGELNKTVAYELGISVRTVEVYRANIMSKSGVASFAELVRLAIRAGFAAD